MFESQTLLKRFIKIEILILFLTLPVTKWVTKCQVILDWHFVSKKKNYSIYHKLVKSDYSTLSFFDTVTKLLSSSGQRRNI